MAVGPLMDALAARKRGVSTLAVLSANNRLMVKGLSFRVRAAFWLTNAPYWWLAASLARAPPPPLAAGSTACAWALFVAAALVAVCSSAFHGAVLFGPTLGLGLGSSYERVTSTLLVGDMLFANAYGVALAAIAGVRRAAGVFAAPVALLSVSAVLKRRGRPVGYAALHGAWHVLSAAGMWLLLYRNVDADVPSDGAIRRPLQ